jgi:2-polyprenyl-3-methyl-5-hydroxy-6-metoxy-1,4-benzoquinol methylase
MYDKEARERKANTMIRVLSHNFGKKKVAQMSLLDVGSSTGIIDNFLSRAFAEVTGIDIDSKAVEPAT